nr:EOG090X0D34 [Lepidurus arcticus]
MADPKLRVCPPRALEEKQTFERTVIIKKSRLLGPYKFNVFIPNIASTSTGVSFGTPASSAAPSYFGGAPASQPVATTGFGTGNFAFGGGNPTNTSVPSFGLGSTPAASTGNLFGSSFAAPTFGGTSTAPGTFGFGNVQPASSAPGFSLLTSTSSAPSFGTFGVTTSSAAPAFGFGIGTSTASAPSFGFGAAGTSVAPTQPTFGLGTSLGAATNTTTAQPFGLGGISSVGLGGTTTTMSTGLGGVSTAGLAITMAQGKQDTKAIKETTVPPEIVQGVEDYKNFLKEQKAMREGIARASSNPMLKVQEEVDGLKQLLVSLAMGIQKNGVIVDKLKKDVEFELQNAEMAQKTKDTPLGLQLEHTAPNDYFARLVLDFENRTSLYKHHIEEMERNLGTTTRKEALTPEELIEMLKKVHEAFVALAGRLYTIHEAIREQKAKFLQRRRDFGDTSDVFANKTNYRALNLQNKPKRLAGPSPFGDGNDALTRTMANLANATHYTNPSSTPSNPGTRLITAALGSSFALDVGMVILDPDNFVLNPFCLSGLGNVSYSTGLGGSVNPPTENGSFTLRSPPTGTKRGKR